MASRPKRGAVGRGIRLTAVRSPVLRSLCFLFMAIDANCGAAVSTKLARVGTRPGHSLFPSKPRLYPAPAHPPPAQNRPKALDISPPRIESTPEIPLVNGSTAESLIAMLHTEHMAGYATQRKAVAGRYAVLQAALLAKQGQGEGLACAQQIAQEVHWLYHYTDWFDLAVVRLDDLNASVREGGQQAWAGVQQQDGLWGPCFSPGPQFFHLRLSYSMDGIQVAFSRNATLEHPLTALANASSPVRDPEAAVAWINHLYTSDIASDGVDRRSELNSAVSFVALAGFWYRGAFGKLTTGWTVDEEYATAVAHVLDGLQSPSTGYYGARYVVPPSLPLAHDVGGERVVGTADLSITFHITRYRTNGGDHPPKHVGPTASWTLASVEEPYPYGLELTRAQNGTFVDGFDNHNDYDAATLLGIGWDELTSPDQASGRSLLAQMQSWALGSASMERRGNTTELVCAGDDSIGDCYYFGVAFFDSIGFFRTSPPFWSNTTYFGAHTICCGLREAFESLHVDSGIGVTVGPRLDADCPAPSCG